LVIGYWLLVVGCWLLVIGYWLLVVGYWLLVISHQEEGRIVGDRTPSSLHIIFPRTTTIKLVRSEDFSPHKN
jgi:uncharacterized membrane protein